MTRRTSKPLRRPAIGLAAVTLLWLLAAFFAWQGAEPLWLTLGRGEHGTATVTRCVTSETDPEAPTYRCVTFEATSGAFQARDVTLRGAGDAARTEGATVPARMVAAERERAYAADPVGLHLRWLLGFLLVVACGFGAIWASGATRLEGTRQRQLAAGISLAGPLLLAAGFVAAAY